MRRLLPLSVLALVAVLAAPAEARRAPEPEAALSGITQLEAGDDHTCAVTTAGQVRCWGHGGFRQLGNGLTSSPGIPNTVLNTAGTSPLTGITQVTAGAAYTCARTAAGQARCWGYNLDGQLGVGDQSVHTYPVIVKGVGGTGRLTGVTQVSAGWNHACARVAGGQVRCWGTNNKGQIGDDSNSLRTTPTVVLAPTGTGPLTGATQLSSGIFFNCARLNTGRVACWGSNGNNQLGDGSDDDRDRPVQVRNSANTGPLTGVRQVAAGGYFACALLTSGQARCWGAVPSGSSELPVGVLNANGSGPLTGITSISAGFNHVCFRLSTGRLRCLGANGLGELGDLTTTPRANPVLMVNTAGTSPATGVTAVTAGEHHTCARLSTTQLICTGANDVGQLGAGPGPSTARPIGVRRN